MTLCNLVILGNALDFRTYSAPNQEEDVEATILQKDRMEKYDLNNIEREERHEMILVRGMCVHLLIWLSCNYEVINTRNGSTVEAYDRFYLGKLAAAILAYKELASKQQVIGAPHCTSKMLRAQLTNALSIWVGSYNTFLEQLKNGVSGLDYGGKAQFLTIRKREEPRNPGGRFIFILNIGLFLTYSSGLRDSVSKSRHDTI